MKSFKHSALAAALLAACGLVHADTAAPTASAGAVPLTIEAQPLETALNEFAKQTGLQVLFPTDRTIAMLKSARLSGTFTPEAALKQLLAGSGLQYEFVNARTITIRAVRSGAQNGQLEGGATQTLRLAQGDGTASQKSGASDADGTVEEMLVEGERDKPAPFTDRNIDLPRSIDDAQAYYIFDAKIIERSGATSIEDFLKNRLTMNTIQVTGGQRAGADGVAVASAVNLRGLGEDNTLILVNGRRMAGVSMTGIDKQPDINGIPLSAIERIEVLPTSASGIYGGSAIGGVVNIILKRDYSGGAMQVSYRSTWDGHAPMRNVSGTFGTKFRDGATSLMLSAHYSDSEPMTIGDRRDFFDPYFQTVLARDPGKFGYFANTPIEGPTPNIVISGSDTSSSLTLKSNGASLGSHMATLPEGYSSASSASAIVGGEWSTGFAESTTSPRGLLYYFGNFPRNHSLMGVLRQRLTDNIDLYVEATYARNEASGQFNPFITLVYVPASSPANPFEQDVEIAFPVALQAPTESRSDTRMMTVGGALRLPGDWSAQLDYTWSRNEFDSSLYLGDDSSMRAHFEDGTLNPFVDTLRYPLNLAQYLVPRRYDNESSAASAGLRAAGPLPSLPWGRPTLALALEHRTNKRPDTAMAYTWPLQPLLDQYDTYFSQSSVIDNAYLETTVPLMRKGRAYPLLQMLELQAAVRADRYSVDAGTNGISLFPNETPPRMSYNGPTLNGEPYRYETRYSSINKTLGLRYKPLESVMVRASVAAAFLPPTYSQLLPNPLPNPNITRVVDPLNPNPNPLPADCRQNSPNVWRCPVQVLSGGNPDLKPQNSKSFNAGIIWEPGTPALRGLRANLEYYKIDQFDKIGSLQPQQIVNLENSYPDRVVRSDTTGLITLVNASLVNLTKYASDGWDVTLDYTRNTGVGRIGLRFAGTLILHERRQLALNAPLLDYVGYPNNGGEAEIKGNVSLDWEHRNWAAGWTAIYFGSYMQYGAPGSPDGEDPYWVELQGSPGIPAQVYHDLFVSYSFAGTASPSAGRVRLLRDLKLQFGISNVFGKLPPLDVSQSPFFYSPYGSARLRDYTLTVTRQF